MTRWNYHSVYGYPWRYAIPAEMAWRLEHLPWRHDGQVFAPLARWAYRKRKHFERLGYENRDGLSD